MTRPGVAAEPMTRPTVTVDLSALVANHRRIVDQASTGSRPAEVAAVVKADGYGLGADLVGATLWDQGCRRFFVARIDEGLALRSVLPDAQILVFDGVLPGTGPDLVDSGLIPVLNSLEQAAAWRKLADSGDQLRAALHLDTGMRRLGLPPDEVGALAEDPALLDGIDVVMVLSHLASADVDGHPQSAAQLAAFQELRARFPMGVASLANSAGTFLGPDYLFDIVRPGISLYGGSPYPDSGRPNPLNQVVTMTAPIIQVRTATDGETVGYGATHRVSGEARIATVPVGYADGFLRSSSNTGQASVAGQRVPIVGRISMDLITLDVTGVSADAVRPGMPVELMGPNIPVDEVAERAGSIPYEFLTNLGGRFARRTLPASARDSSA